MKSQSEQEPKCCHKFDPIPWDDKSFEWANKKFIKDKGFYTVLHAFKFWRGYETARRKTNQSRCNNAR